LSRENFSLFPLKEKQGLVLVQLKHILQLTYVNRKDRFFLSLRTYALVASENVASGQYNC